MGLPGDPDQPTTRHQACNLSTRQETSVAEIVYNRHALTHINTATAEISRMTIFLSGESRTDARDRITGLPLPNGESAVGFCAELDGPISGAWAPVVMEESKRPKAPSMLNENVLDIISPDHPFPNRVRSALLPQQEKEQSICRAYTNVSISSMDITTANLERATHGRIRLLRIPPAHTAGPRIAALPRLVAQRELHIIVLTLGCDDHDI